MMTMWLNDEKIELAAPTTVAQLCERRRISRDGVAIVIDSKVIPRSSYETTLIPDGARLEIIRAVAGG